ncbi:MAG: 2-dehydropantoate 2-reductase [Aliidiomarina sp.]|uniref:ketopantoate reductase family protein n=1 Tax=Aliidiomarina sp. TaxID=1872439 RepID=UPI0025C2D08B|nr:2-dehydropantoate 2-reductase [Aliidiomarina sp.]MCH8501468.1 2-dehydropantoate 2-reductase [Aliidiomarina sp.]
MTRWVVVGTGALGSHWAAALSRAGEDVQLYVRDRQHKQLDITTSVHEQISHSSLPVCQTAAAAGKDAVWLVFVKAWQLEPLLLQLVDEGLPQQAQLIVSHNGMGAAEELIQEHPDWQVFDLVTTHGAWRQDRYHSILAGLGHSWLGARHAAAQPQWFTTLAAAFPPLTWTDDITLRRWHKLAINCAINPLATLAQSSNGVLRSDSARTKIRAVCEEIAKVNLALDANELEAQVHEVIRATAGNRCSMLQDITAGRRTEIDYLNGFICRQGVEKQIVTRTNCELADQIRVLEASANPQL